MKRLYFGFRMAAAAMVALFAASCTGMDDISSDFSNTGFRLSVAEYPGYDSPSKAVGIEDAGKTGWTAGDVIMLSVGDSRYSLSFNGSAWTPDRNIAETGTVQISAYYAPDYEWGDDALPVLKSGSYAGLDEYLVYSSEHDMSTALVIDFNGCRDYSRIRVVALPEEKVTLSGAFVCNAESSELTSPLETVADANGNAFFFGNWNEKSELTFTVGGIDINKNMPVASAAGKAFVTYTAGFEYDSENALFKIKDARALKIFAELVNSGSASLNARLENDIDLSGLCGPEIGNWVPIGSTSYLGVFDGNGKTVSSLYIESSSPKQGLFAVVKAPGEIKNLKVSGTVKSEGALHIGGIVGNLQAKISGCTFEGEVFGGESVGGLVGATYGTAVVVSDCVNRASVTGDKYVGGVVGSLPAALMEYCTNYGEVQASVDYAGGLIGYFYNPGAKGVALVNHGSVTSKSAAGAIVGYFYGKGAIVAYCANDGQVKGILDGGIVGNANAYPEISACYSNGNVRNGIAGKLWNTSVNAAYWAGTSTQAFGGRGGEGTLDIQQVDGVSVQWNAGEGSSNAAEHMNSFSPELGWKFIANEGDNADSMPLIPVRRN